MRFDNLQSWLEWQETLHPFEIELGLERVSSVWKRVRPEGLSPLIVTVGGTNGKGSTITLIESILLAAGYRVGSYTSPHLIRYNERIRINGEEIDDESVCRAFDRIDTIRGEISLTYFEFGTLAAFDIFCDHTLDVILLEVGLGGRLDAVNIVDPDVAVITSIDIDHIAWLGDTRDVIGIEKAGIFRADTPAIVGDFDPPETVLEVAESVGAKLQLIGEDFGFEPSGGHWSWWSVACSETDLPLPNLSGHVQLGNASVALEVLAQLKDRITIERASIEKGLVEARLAGRYQQIVDRDVTTILDVAHNPHAAKALANTLEKHPVEGNTVAIIGMMDDKDVEGVVSAMNSVVDRWFLAGIPGSRGLDVDALSRRMPEVGVDIRLFETVKEAYSMAKEMSDAQGRVVVFGSFLTVAEVLDEAL